MPRPPHADVAERFARFLKEVGLSREAFAAAVDDAISPRSLFSVLNGHRRPSRALAVLVERSWGFRADFLLEGQGEMWTQPAYASSSVGGSVLSPLEAAVVGYMRESVENARAMDEQLEIAESWARLLGRLGELTDALTTTATGPDAEPDVYPLLARLVFGEVRFAARQHEQLATLLHQRRLEELLDRLLDRFLREFPRSFVGDVGAARLDAALETLSERREELRTSLDDALTRVRENLRDLEGPDTFVELARSRANKIRDRRQRATELGALAAPRHAAEARALVAELGGPASDAERVVHWLERVARELARDALSTSIDRPEFPTREPLHERFAGILDTFAA